LIYSSYRSRGLEYKQTPHIDRKKRQRSKDYEPQKRVTFVLEKPIPRFSKNLEQGSYINPSCLVGEGPHILVGGICGYATLGNSPGRAYVSFLGRYLARRNSMTKSARIAVAVALLLVGTSLAMAKTRGAAGAHRHPSHPSINETTSRPTPANPYYRLSEQYYGYSDPYRDFLAVPPYIPG
jgi:hypothetical protein